MDKKTRICTFCRKELELNEENFNLANSPGFQGHGYGCRKCMTLQERKRYEKRRDYFLEYQKKWYQENKEKSSAHDKVRRAIKRGIIEVSPCEVCGVEEVHGHHDDYSKPLSVRWLCDRHHRKHHQDTQINK